MNKKGFTLVELLAVIAILAILVIIALPNVLKMFNDSKKNSFLTEAKTIYSEVSKKYISESMKGNKLTYVSSEDDTKLDMTGKSLKYCVLLNDDGSVSEMKVSNGTWVATLPKGKKITDLNASNVTEGNLDNDSTCPKSPKSFATDSWDTISSAVKSNNTSKYKVGDTKEVDVGTYGKHIVRIANMSTPSDCNTEGFSQSACGFVLEFADIITTHNKMNDTATNKGGWPASSMYTYLNNNIYNALPEDLKGVIKETITVSGHGIDDTDNFTSPEDKLYLLAPKEIYSDISNEYDTANDKTRQLDYYKEKGKDGAIKKNSTGTALAWWLRCANSYDNNSFYGVYNNGSWISHFANITYGVSPAFRIG